MGRMVAGETEPAGPPDGSAAAGAPDVPDVPDAPATVKGRRPADYTISVLGKALDLLDVLADARSVSLPEISQRAGINKVTAFRILANFEERGYVEREPGSGQYRLGLRLLELSTRLRERLDLRTVARPHLEALRAAVGETVNLAVPGDRGIVYVDILESAYGLRMAASVGEADEYHCTALGKAMLAFWPEERRAGRARRAAPDAEDGAHPDRPPGAAPRPGPVPRAGLRRGRRGERGRRALRRGAGAGRQRLGGGRAQRLRTGQPGDPGAGAGRRRPGGAGGGCGQPGDGCGAGLAAT